MRIRILNSGTQTEVQRVDLKALLAGDGSCFVGRSPNSGLVLDSPNVSRLHGKLARREGEFYFSDLGSTNGSMVQDQIAAVNQDYRLHPGDIVYIGGFTLVFEDLVLDSPVAEVDVIHDELAATALDAISNESADESADESVNESVNESLAQPIEQPIGLLEDLPANQSIELSIDRSADSSINPSIDPPTDSSINSSTDPSIDPSTDSSIDPSTDLSESVAEPETASEPEAAIELIEAEVVPDSPGALVPYQRGSITPSLEIKTRALLNVIRRRAIADLRITGKFTREAFLKAAQTAKDSIEEHIDQEQLEQEFEKYWQSMTQTSAAVGTRLGESAAKGAAELGSRLGSAAKAAWKEFVAPPPQESPKQESPKTALDNISAENSPEDSSNPIDSNPIDSNPSDPADPTAPEITDSDDRKN